VFCLLVVGRWLGAVAGGALLTALAGRRGVRITVPGLGLGLLPQGELALGLVVALVGFVGASDGVLEAVVSAIALHQLAGQWWMRHRLFRDSGGSG